MFTQRKKTGSKSGEIKPENRLLRMLRSNTGSQDSPVSLDRTEQEDSYHEPFQDARNAMLEAEFIKAKAIMTIQQQHRNFY